ncbi:MAG: T9SS type A sorting domain-containing protein [Ignavibacteria bacterium]
MKGIFSVILFSVISFTTGFSQITVPFVDESSPKSYPIDGTFLIKGAQETVRKYIQENPDYKEQMKLRKTAAWNFTVGSTKSWWASSFINYTYYQVPSTCRKVGTKCYIFVEDASWNSTVTQAGVDSMALYFDSKTPANPNKGIYQSDVDVFGDPPDMDNDPKIIILILDIRDGYEGSGGYIAGFFSSTNEINTAYSNLCEMYYVDCNPLDFTTPYGIKTVAAITAHEFQHMIAFNYDPTSKQAIFINEGCSMLAEVNAGFGIGTQVGQYGYNIETNHYLFDWRDFGNISVLIDYSRASRFFTYMRDQYGIGMFKRMVSTPLFGEAGIIDAIASTGKTVTFKDLFTNFAMANIVDDSSINPAWAYTYPDIPKPTGTIIGNPNSSATAKAVTRLGVEYLTFNAGNNLSMKITSYSPNLVVKALLSGAGGRKVTDVPLNVQFNEPGFGTTYNTVTFALIDPVDASEGSTGATYSYTSGGTIQALELAYDVTEPTGYYVWSINDTVAVQFDAVKDGKLDSIRVALRRPGSINGGIYEYTGVWQPTPLGKKLPYPITASIATETPVPYPVPFNNWSGIDLRSYNINTDNPFVVAFTIGSDPKTPGVMVTKYKSTGAYHSYTYLNAPSGGDPANWYFISPATDTVALYCIRAYISFGTTGVEQKTTELTPKSFTLSQNYPNPFNPATTISYQLPEAGMATLKIFNMLGNEICTLVNEFKQAGQYNVTFAAQGLPSGIYVYKLSSGRYSETRKLVLMK